MSDTPKTDELAKREFVPDGVWIRHARELERENVALREENRKAHDMACEDAVERYRLNGENAALRQELEDVNRVRNSIEGALADAYDEAEADWMSRSRLADAAEEVLRAYINVVRVETGHPCPENLVICRDLRAAIDAARAKEAQL